MAAWAAAPAEHDSAPSRQPRARPRPRATRRQRTRVSGGVLWIAVLAVLLAGVVALNVAVLRLNVTLDRLGRERGQLRSDTAALQSQLSSAAATGRIESTAIKRLGYAPATPDQTTYVQLGK
jgi:cell division protein FtsL